MIEFLFLRDVIEGTRVPAKPFLVLLVNDLIYVVGFVGPLSFVFKRLVLVILFDLGYAAAPLRFTLQRQV